MTELNRISRFSALIIRSLCHTIALEPTVQIMPFNTKYKLIGTKIAISASKQRMESLSGFIGTTLEVYNITETRTKPRDSLQFTIILTKLEIA